MKAQWKDCKPDAFENPCKLAHSLPLCLRTAGDTINDQIDADGGSVAARSSGSNQNIPAAKEENKE
uniref:Uncharacterized protein n=1 Tax=Burkholderia sp. (strain CCGE1003) TaxID=640512 RepID=E1TF60_BURSG